MKDLKEQAKFIREAYAEYCRSVNNRSCDQTTAWEFAFNFVCDIHKPLDVILTAIEEEEKKE